MSEVVAIIKDIFVATPEPNMSHSSSQMKLEHSSILRSLSWYSFVNCVLGVTTCFLYDVFVVCCMNGLRVISRIMVVCGKTRVCDQQ